VAEPEPVIEPEPEPVIDPEPESVLVAEPEPVAAEEPELEPILIAEPETRTCGGTRAGARRRARTDAYCDRTDSMEIRNVPPPKARLNPGFQSVVIAASQAGVSSGDQPALAAENRDRPAPRPEAAAPPKPAIPAVAVKVVTPEIKPTPAPVKVVAPEV